MSAEIVPSTRLSARALPVAEALERLYAQLLVTDVRGRVLWVSAGWRARCGSGGEALGRDLRETIPRLPLPEQSFAILSQLRERGFILRAPVSIPDPVEVSILPLAIGPEPAPHHLVVVRPGAGAEEEAAPDGLVDALPDAVLAVDASGFLRSANPAASALLGIPVDELVGSPAAVLARGADELTALVDALCSDAPTRVELTLRRNALEPVVVSASVAPLRSAGGGSVISLRDAGAQLRADREVARRADELDHCVNTLAHDLRSPLVALLGFSRLLRQDYAAVLDETALHFVDRIEQAGRTMEALIHDLLELSRIGQPGERRSLVDPRGVLHQIAAEQKPRLEEREIRLDLPDSPPMLYCDRTRLYQVFSNLIGNAIEHMGECQDRRVVVEVLQDVEVDRISVRDFGVGIAPEHHERIFEAFHSLRPRGQRSAGTGMGLAIVRKIAEIHGGRAWVESRPGAGATFHVTLPRI